MGRAERMEKRLGNNDLLSTNRELIKEWDFEKNEIKPTEVTAGSQKKVWWKCEKGHEWYQQISTRLKPNHLGCPFCSGKSVIPGINDVFTLYPSLINEWDYSKNTGLDPRKLSPFSNKKVWWICNKGHEWTTSIEARTNKGRNCPYCSNQKVLKGYNDLASLYPDLASEWNYERNNGVTPDQLTAHSGKKYWWICGKGHEWEATVASRVSGRGCRQCSRELCTSFPEQAVFFYIRKVFSDAINGFSEKDISEIDVYIPSVKVGIEYDGQFYHSNASRDARKDSILHAKGIRAIRIKEKTGFDYGEQLFIEIGDCIYYDPRHAERLNNVIDRVFHILNTETIPTIDTEKDRVEIWNQYIERVKANSLAALFPDISEEWNYEKNGSLTPDKVSYRSGKKVWWKCQKCGKEWEAAISHRTNGTGCPDCAPDKISKKLSKVIPGKNDLITMNPELAAEWNYEKNIDIDPHGIHYGSRMLVWWKCKYCGYEYQASVIQRTHRHTMCKKCTYAIKKGNLADSNPELLKDWDYLKNKDIDPKLITPGSGKRVWWKCNLCGFEWEARVSHRVNGCKCPRCAQTFATKKNVKAVYQYSMDGELIANYVSVAEAKRQTGVSGIYDCCAHRLGSSGGYVWRYENEKL